MDSQNETVVPIPDWLLDRSPANRILVSLTGHHRSACGAPIASAPHLNTGRSSTIRSPVISRRRDGETPSGC
jgi:hypothetical protein